MPLTPPSRWPATGSDPPPAGRALLPPEVAGADAPIDTYRRGHRRGCAILCLSYGRRDQGLTLWAGAWRLEIHRCNRDALGSALPVLRHLRCFINIRHITVLAFSPLWNAGMGGFVCRSLHSNRSSSESGLKRRPRRRAGPPGVATLRTCPAASVSTSRTCTESRPSLGPTWKRWGWNCEVGWRLRKRESERIRQWLKEVWYDTIDWPVPRQEVSML